MAKIILVKNADPMTVKYKAMPLIEAYSKKHNLPFYTNSGDIYLTAYVSEKPDLTRMLNKISGGVVILNVVNNPVPHKDPVCHFSLSKHMCDQVKALFTNDWPFDLIITGRHLPEAATFLADMYIEEDGKDVYKIKRVSPTYVTCWFGNELAQATKDKLQQSVRGLDVDGDVAYGKLYHFTAGIYSKGVHPYLINSNTAPSEPTDPTGKIVCSDIIALANKNDDAYQRLLEDYFYLSTRQAVLEYTDQPADVVIDKGLNSVSLEPLTVCDLIKDISEFPSNATLSYEHKLHPYTLHLVVEQMHADQMLSIDGKDYTKLQLTLLLKHSKYFYNRQLRVFLTTVEAPFNTLWTVGYQ